MAYDARPHRPFIDLKLSFCFRPSHATIEKRHVAFNWVKLSDARSECHSSFPERKLAVFRFRRRRGIPRRCQPDLKTASYCVSRKRLAFKSITCVRLYHRLCHIIFFKSYTFNPPKSYHPLPSSLFPPRSSLLSQTIPEPASDGCGFCLSATKRFVPSTVILLDLRDIFSCGAILYHKFSLPRDSSAYF